MRQDFDFLGLPRPGGPRRSRVLAALIGGTGLFLVLLGIGLFTGATSTDQPVPAWIIIVMIVVGVGCMAASGVLNARHTKDEDPSR